MVNQDLEIVEVAFTIIAPRSGENLFGVGVVTLLLGHVELRRAGKNRWMDREATSRVWSRPRFGSRSEGRAVLLYEGARGGREGDGRFNDVDVDIDTGVKR